MTRQRSTRVLIVDDDAAMLAATRLALEGTVFDDRPVEFHYADSAADARARFQDGGPFAAAIVDVVMENDMAGLDLIDWVREDFGDTLVRLLVRTGHPGDAPEGAVTARYDIDAYLPKTEATAQRLRGALMAALRVHRELWTLTEAMEDRGARLARIDEQLKHADAVDDMVAQIRKILVEG